MLGAIFLPIDTPFVLSVKYALWVPVLLVSDHGYVSAETDVHSPIAVIVTAFCIKEPSPLHSIALPPVI
jgi:hypothetical protein